MNSRVTLRDPRSQHLRRSPGPGIVLILLSPLPNDWWRYIYQLPPLVLAQQAREASGLRNSGDRSGDPQHPQHSWIQRINILLR